MERKLPGRNFRKFGFTSRGCRVCLETSGNADPFTTAEVVGNSNRGSFGCRNVKCLKSTLVHKGTFLSKGFF